MQQDAFSRSERRSMCEVAWQLGPGFEARQQFSNLVNFENTNVDNAFTSDECDTSARCTRTQVARRYQQQIEIRPAIPLSFNDRPDCKQHVVRTKPHRLLHMQENGR